jgi:hypothetical protein
LVKSRCSTHATNGLGRKLFGYLVVRGVSFGV